MKKVLILKVGALGDVVRTTYFLPGILKKYNNEVEIYWITSRNAFDLLKENKYITKLICIEEEKELEELKDYIFDWVISLEDEEKIYVKIEDFKYRKLSGVYRNEKKLIYTKDLEVWFDMGLLSKYGKERADKLKRENTLSHREIFSKGLGIEVLKPYFYNDVILENETALEFKKYKKNNKTKLIGLNFNAGKRWPSKSLREEEGEKLIRELLKNQNNYIFLLGGKDDFEANQELYKKFKEYENVIFLRPCSLKKFAVIIKQMDILVTSDTLALHLAIAQNIKTVSYYAPTSAIEIDTFGNGEKIISEKEDYCSYKPFADNSTITAEKILEKIQKG